MDNRIDNGRYNPWPSTSICIVAVIQVAVSSVILFVWGWLLWGLAVYYHRYPKNHQVFAPEIWFFCIVLPVGFAVLGLVTSIGLWRLREWARQRTIFLSIVPVTVYTLLLLLHPQSLFGTQDSPGGLYAVGDIYGFVVGCLIAVLIPISIGWLVLFTRPSVKAQFRSGKEVRA